MENSMVTRRTTIPMIAATGLGLVFGFTAAPIGDFSLFDWISGAAVAALLIALIVYLVQGRSPLGQIPEDEQGRRRWRTWSIVGVIAMAFVLFLNLGSAWTGSFDPSDGFVVGIWLALLVLFIGRLRALSAK